MHMPGGIVFWPMLSLIRRRVSLLVAYIGDDFESYSNGTSAKAQLKTNVFKHAHRVILSKCDGVIARGKHLASLASKRNKHVIETLPLAHMPKEMKPYRQPDLQQGYHVLCVGRMLWTKGFRQLLDAVDQLNQQGRDVRLTIIGDGLDAEGIRSYGASVDSASKIVFTGYLSDQQTLQTYWNQADLLVVPTSEHKEGVPRVIEEALAYGMPVVATRIGGITKEFESGQEVLLVEPADTEALRLGIEKMMDDPAMAEAYLQRGQMRLKRFIEGGKPAEQHLRFMDSLSQQT
jgi:glycosyltransferase involved in cell wall biosynthesis